MLWARWHARTGSLRRFLLLWLLGSVWIIVGLFTLIQGSLLSIRLAQVQDDRLVRELAKLPMQMEREQLRWMTANRDVESTGLSAMGLGSERYRMSDLNGDWQGGEEGLAPFPWRSDLSPTGGATLYFSHIRGSLVRAGAARRQMSSDEGGAPVVVQVAAPWLERLPGWRTLILQPPLNWVYASATLTSIAIVLGVTMALHWLDQARRSLDISAETYVGPSELQPAVTRMRELQRKQLNWVEEQRRFVADASHQLRTPMAVLRTQLQSAIAGDVPAAAVLPQMLHTVDRAAGLANHLLSMTKLEQLKASGQLQALNLYAMARDAVMDLAPLIAAKRLDFVLEGPELRAAGDPIMLGELVRNLLGNAIHHAPPAGRVGVLLRQGAGRIELVVWDEGPGIDDDVRPRLFQPFTAAKGGVGLGLSICKQIADAMGASMNLYNRIDRGRVIGVDAVVAWGQGP